MPAALADDLSRTRALFEQWRATRSSLHEKIPEELWQAVVALRDRYPVSQLCRELHLSAGALRARLRQADTQPVAPAPAEFVPLRLEMLGLPGADLSDLILQLEESPGPGLPRPCKPLKIQ